MNSALHVLRGGEDLSFDEAASVANQLLSGTVESQQIIELLTLLNAKGESSDEILAFIQVMRQQMTPLSFTQSPIIDICGTGGSLPNRFNVSTCAALLLGKLGYAVAKHGNRGSKKANGSFDFLDALGIRYDLTTEGHQARLNDTGSTFLFARNYHPAMRHVAQARSQLAGRSIFNLIGPFCNPASPTIQIIGAPNQALAKRILDVGAALEYDTFAVITSDIGLDECSTVGASTLYIQRNKSRFEIIIQPEDYGFFHTLSDITVSEHALARDNANVFKDIIASNNVTHPIAQLIALNAAVIMHVIDESITIEDGIHQVFSTFSKLTI